jgi:hypothetical protein
LRTEKKVRQLRWAPLLVGLILFLVAGFAWYLLVLLREPNAWEIWKAELARVKDPEAHRNPWYRYLLLIPYLAPWSVFLVLGLISAFRRRDSRDVLLLVLLFGPLLVMCFFPDRHERYMLPLLPAAAIITARSIVEFRNVRWIAQLHWLVVAAIGVAFPIVAAFILKRLDGRPWISSTVAFSAALIAAIVIVVCFARRTSLGLLLGTAVVILATQYLFMAGYSQTQQGLAEFRPLAEQIWSLSPDAEVFNAHPKGKRPPPEIGVYLNRTLWHVDDPSPLQAGERDKVLLMLQDKKQPPPTPPPGWSKLGEKVSEGEGWQAFLLPRRDRLTSTTRP